MIRPSSRKSKWQKIISWITLATFTLQPTLTAAQVVADPNAAAGNRPVVDSAQNGVPVVQIATPSAAGVSHNLYQQFDIDAKGLILNNALGMSKTQLAGYILGNSNLTNGSARIILNEVTGTNLSNLQGYLEVAGQKADVILANPNGIMGNGFGFINTGRGILTTGVPVFGGSGTLEAFRVTRGNITVEDKGIDGTGADRVDLISQAVAVNAGIWANELNVVTGANEVDANTLDTRILTGEGVKPQVAIDVSALGGMYAGKIKLVGTEKGVGVNSKGTLAASSGDFILDQAGDISVAGTVSAAGNMKITATGDMTNNATLYAKKNSAVTAGGLVSNNGTIAAGKDLKLKANEITSTGTLAAGIDSDGNWSEEGHLTVNSTGDMYTSGQNLASGALNMTGKRLDVKGATLYAGKSVSLQATNGDIDSTNGKIGSEGTVNLTATGNINNQNGQISAADQLILKAQALKNQAGILKSDGTLEVLVGTTLNNQSGQIEGQAVNIDAQDIQNQGGRIANLAENELQLNITGVLDNADGSIGSNGTLNIQTKQLKNTDGQLVAKDTLTLTAEDTIDNEKGKVGSNRDVILTTKKLNNHTGGNIVAKENATLHVGEQLSNDSGTILAGSDVTLVQQSGTVTNTAGIIQAGDDLTVKAESAVINGGEFLAGGDIKINVEGFTGDKLTAGKDMTIQAKTDIAIDKAAQSSGTLTVNAGGKLTNSGNIAGIKGVKIHSDSINNEAEAAIKSGSTLELLQEELNNKGILFSKDKMTITAQEQLSTSGTIAGENDIDITGKNITSTGMLLAGLDANGALGSSGNLNLIADGTVTATGQNIAGGNLSVQGGDIVLSGAKTYAGQGAIVTAVSGDVDNSGGNLTASDTITIVAKDKFVNDQAVTTANQLQLIAKNIDNRGGSLAQYGQSDLVLNAEKLDNTSGQIAANSENLSIHASEIDNSKGQIQHAGNGKLTVTTTETLQNSEGKIISNQALDVSSKKIINDQGTISAKGDLTMQAEHLANTSGIVVSSENVDIKAKTLNNVKGQVLSGKDLLISTEGDLDNSNGEMAAGQDLKILQQSADFTNEKGTLQAGRNLEIASATFHGAQGKLAAKEDAKLDFTKVADAGSVNAGKNLNSTVDGDFTSAQDSKWQATNNLSLNVSGTINNGGAIEADGDLNISGQKVANSAGASMTANRELTVSATDEVKNSGSLFGKEVKVAASQISNVGQTAVIAATDSVKLYAKNELTNSDGALIYSMGNIDIAGSEEKDENGTYTTRAKTLTNQSANIEADQNIALYADDVVNKKQNFVVEEKVFSSKDIEKTEKFYDSEPDSPINWGEVIYSSNEKISETTILLDSPEARILAGKNIFVQADTLQNAYSSILAGAKLDAYVDVLDNIGVNGKRITTQSGSYKLEIHNKNGEILESISPIYEQTVEDIFNMPALFGGGQAVNIQGSNINNTTATQYSFNDIGKKIDSFENNGKDTALNELSTSPDSNVSTEVIQRVQSETTDQSNTGAYNSDLIKLVDVLPSSYAQNEKVTAPQTNNGGTIILPQNGLYTIETSPTAKYLVETNPKFSNYKTFISSDYLLSQLGYDSAAIMKRLGDGFYEQKLVRDQITELTGRTYLNGYGSAEEQYQSLLKNAVTTANDLNLTIGIALTTQQQAALTQNMIWLVEQEVSGQKVLVPVVYLAALSKSNLKTSGAIISAEHVNINVTGDVLNTGTIQATENTKIEAGNVSNIGGNINSGKLTEITVDQDILNLSGNIGGNDINLIAGGDLVSQTYYDSKNVNGYYKTTILGKTAGISADNTLTIGSGQDLSLNGTNLSAGTDINLSAKNISIGVVADIDKLSLSTEIGKISQNENEEAIVNIGTAINSGGNLSLKAEKDISIEAATFSAETNISVVAGDKLNVTSAADTYTSEYKLGNSSISSISNDSNRTLTNVETDIKAGGNLNLQAGTDVSMQAAELKAGNDLTIAAGNNLTLTAVTDTANSDYNLNASNFNHQNIVSNQLTSLEAGENLTLTSNGDMTLNAVQATGKTITARSSGDLTLSSVIDSEFSDVKKGNSRNYERNMSYDETNVGTDLTSEKDITLQAGSSITFSGSSAVSEQGKVNLTAEQDITLESVTEKHETLTESKKSKSGFLSKKTTEKRDYSLTNEVVGSTISGDTVEIKSGDDLTVKASSIVGTNDVTLNAKSDINLEIADETGASEHYSYTKKSGLFSGGGLGFTIGSQSEKSTLNEQILAQIGSTIGSHEGNITIQAGNDLDSQGTTMISGKDINLTGKEVTLDNSVDTYDSQYKYEFKQSGLSVSLGGAVIDSALASANEVKRSGEVQDDRLKTLYAYKAAEDLQKVKDEFAKNGGKPSIGVNISFGSSKTTVDQNTHIETVNTSNITAGDNVNIKATEADINLKGTNITAGEDITLKAKQDINIDAAQNKEQIDTKTSSSSWSVGGTIGSGAFANFSKGSGKENENAVTHTGSTVDANGTLTLESGNDTNITGSKVEGEKVIADIGGDLNIASLQDADDYNSSSKNIGGGFGTGKISGTHGSAGKSKTDSTYESVTNQAGIYAGKGGFDIEVGKNTDLKGAVISSEATPDKNKLSTDTLTYSDIANKAEYSSSSTGVSYNNGRGVEEKDQGWTPNLGVTASDSASSTTKSAIADATIEVRSNPNQDLSGLSRNTEQALNALGKIFDKKKVQEQQELAGLFGEVAFKAIGDLGLKEGSAEKVALDAFAGGLMAKFGGGNFASGAAGAGFNQLVMNELKNIKDPGLMKMASALIGVVATKIVGGDGNTGASVAVSETKNNFLYHKQYADYQKELEELEVKLKNKSITSEEYKEAVQEVEKYWSDIDKKNEEKLNRDWIKNVTEGTQFGVTMKGEPFFVFPESRQGDSSGYIFDLKAFWDYGAGVGRGILGLPNLPGSEYSDKSNAFKYGYSVGNRAMPWAINLGGLGVSNPFLRSPEFAVGYNGTAAQTRAVDAWKFWYSGSILTNPYQYNASDSKNTGNSSVGDTKEPGKAGPNGTFENASYHGSVGNSVKSKAPKNGQAALDNSVSVNSETTPRRIGVSEGEIVILDQTSDGIFHGHVRTWDGLTPKMRSVLLKAGLVDKKGNVI